ncbi:alanine and proline-rich secreted protein Apa [Nocardia sp. NBC_01503]|uniref:APA family fibronectin-binding glycoprotein n=1 Tax=Nocardia sp. NBC_01503 TaxID=2975997 RepID=UPI002E7C0EB2|nr:APA family fibronectin-binding glycoprotein [Nocardia sp. NBC_01503]WTL33382.1 alanine and proline-rich secreted protein Apa [Nocardia sp. NBC_01503]
MEPNETDTPVSPRTARWVIILCVLTLIGSLAGIGYSIFDQVRRTQDEADRIASAAAGMSFVAPDGWQQMPQDEGDHLIFGQAALEKQGGGDGMILIGKLDESLFAAAEPDDTRAACSLGSGMGEFFFPDTGKRVDTETLDVKGREVTGKSCFYRVRFDDSSTPQAEIYSAVVQSDSRRWWVCWLGNTEAPVDRTAAERLAASIRPM